VNLKNIEKFLETKIKTGVTLGVTQVFVDGETFC
jgi:5,10-methylenetetrahydrofolate reductase